VIQTFDKSSWVVGCKTKVRSLEFLLKMFS